MAFPKDFISYDTFYKPAGGLLLAMGNGIMSGTSLENINTALKEMTLYK